MLKTFNAFVDSFRTPAPEAWFDAAKRGDIEQLRAMSTRVDVHMTETRENDFLSSSKGSTALHYAAQSGHVDAVQFLLTLGLVIDAKDSSGRTPLRAHLDERIIDINIDMLNCLLDHGAEINPIPSLFDTILKHPSYLESDFDAKLAPIYVLSMRGAKTPPGLLKRVASYGALEIVRLLLECGSTPDADELTEALKQVDTPLLPYDDQNALRIQRRISECLIAFGAREPFHRVGGIYYEVNRADLEPFTPPNVSLGNGVVQPKTSALIASSSTQTPQVTTPASSIPEVPKTVFRLKSTLYDAAIENDIESVRILLESKTNYVNTRHGVDRSTALHVAAAHGDVNIVLLLISANASVYARDRRGNTPLHNAIACDRAEVARILLEAGADVNEDNNYNKSPLHLAIECKQLSSNIIEVLLAHGADINAGDGDGLTAKMYAKKMRKFALAEYFENLDSGKIPRPTKSDLNLSPLPIRTLSSSSSIPSITPAKTAVSLPMPATTNGPKVKAQIAPLSISTRATQPAPTSSSLSPVQPTLAVPQSLQPKPTPASKPVAITSSGPKPQATASTVSTTVPPRPLQTATTTTLVNLSAKPSAATSTSGLTPVASPLEPIIPAAKPPVLTPAIIQPLKPGEKPWAPTSGSSNTGANAPPVASSPNSSVGTAAPKPTISSKPSMSGSSSPAPVKIQTPPPATAVPVTLAAKPTFKPMLPTSSTQATADDWGNMVDTFGEHMQHAVGHVGGMTPSSSSSPSGPSSWWPAPSVTSVSQSELSSMLGITQAEMVQLREALAQGIVTNVKLETQLKKLETYHSKRSAWYETLSAPGCEGHLQFSKRFEQILNQVMGACYFISSGYLNLDRQTNQQKIMSMLKLALDSLGFFGFIAKAGELSVKAFEEVHQALPVVELMQGVMESSLVEKLPDSVMIPASCTEAVRKGIRFLTGGGQERAERAGNHVSLSDIEARVFHMTQLVTLSYWEQIQRLTPTAIANFAQIAANVLVFAFKDGGEQGKRIITQMGASEQVLLALAMGSRATETLLELVNQRDPRTNKPVTVTAKALLQSSSIHVEASRTLRPGEVAQSGGRWERQDNITAAKRALLGDRHMTQAHLDYIVAQTQTRGGQVWAAVALSILPVSAAAPATSTSLSLPNPLNLFSHAPRPSPEPYAPLNSDALSQMDTSQATLAQLVAKLEQQQQQALRDQQALEQRLREQAEQNARLQQDLVSLRQQHQKHDDIIRQIVPSDSSPVMVSGGADAQLQLLAEQSSPHPTMSPLVAHHLLSQVPVHQTRLDTTAQELVAAKEEMARMQRQLLMLQGRGAENPPGSSRPRLLTRTRTQTTSRTEQLGFASPKSSTVFRPSNPEKDRHELFKKEQPTQPSSPNTYQ